MAPISLLEEIVMKRIRSVVLVALLPVPAVSCQESKPATP